MPVRFSGQLRPVSLTGRWTLEQERLIPTAIVAYVCDLSTFHTRNRLLDRLRIQILDRLRIQNPRKDGRGIEGIPNRFRAPFLKRGRPVSHEESRTGANLTYAADVARLCFQFGKTIIQVTREGEA